MENRIYGPHEGPDRDNPAAPGAPVALALFAIGGLIVTVCWILWRREILNWLPSGVHVIAWCLGGTAVVILIGGAIYFFVSKPLARAIGQDEAEQNR